MGHIVQFRVLNPVVVVVVVVVVESGFFTSCQAERTIQGSTTRPSSVTFYKPATIAR